MHIERIPASVDPHEFYTKYFLPEVPVIVASVSGSWPAKETWTNGALLKKLHRDGVQKKPLWYEVNPSYMSEDYEMPVLVKKCLNPDVSCLRHTHCRLWINAKDHTTDFHYDGNALFVFNVQVIGKKRWTIISPDTPLVNYPFSHIALRRYRNKELSPAHHTMCTFELRQGDMLFLPAFWTHSVTALEGDNVNLNWTGTKKNMRESLLLQREREMLKCALSLSPLVRPLSYMNETYLARYGGSEQLARALSAPVSHIAMWRRLLYEYAKIPALLRDFEHLETHY